MDIYSATAAVLQFRVSFDTLRLEEAGTPLGVERPPLFSDNPLDVYLQYLEMISSDIAQVVELVESGNYHLESLFLVSYITVTQVRTNLDSERARVMSHLSALGLVPREEWTDELLQKDDLDGVRGDIVEGMHITMAIEMAAQEFARTESKCDEDFVNHLNKLWLSVGTSLLSLRNTFMSIRDRVRTEEEVQLSKAPVAEEEESDYVANDYVAPGAEFDPKELMETLQGFSEEELKHFDVEPLEGEAPQDTMKRAIAALPEAMLEVINRGSKNEDRQEETG